MSILWTKEKIVNKLREIEAKKFISIPPEMFRKDDGIPGQLLEREFGITENNLNIGDLGTYELKGMRKTKKNKLTLFHKKPDVGHTVKELFDQFGYEAPSKRDPAILKRKLFTTITGKRFNNHHLKLIAQSINQVELYNHEEKMSTWKLDFSKIENLVLVQAETEGVTCSKDEKFHFVKAYFCSGLKDVVALINNGTIVMELCVDKAADSTKAPHDRGPHFRIPIPKLEELYFKVEPVDLV